MEYLEFQELRQLSVQGSMSVQHLGEERLHGQLHGERTIQFVDLARLAQGRFYYVTVIVVALQTCPKHP